MSADLHLEAEAVFMAALGVPPDKRPELLDEQCGSNLALRAEVEARYPTRSQVARDRAKRKCGAKVRMRHSNARTDIVSSLHGQALDALHRHAIAPSHRHASEPLHRHASEPWHRQRQNCCTAYDCGSLNAISSPLYPAPLTATTMYWRPLSM